MELTVLFLAFVLLGLFVLLAIPFVLLGLVLGAVCYLLWQIVVLPLRLLGLAVGVGAGVLFFFVKLFLLMLLGVFLLSAFVIGLTPLLPLLLVVAGLWLLLRAPRRRPSPQGRPAV